MKVQGAVAVVAGGASGLGLAAVRRLHAAGALVAVLDRDEQAGRAVADELGEACRFAPADVTDAEAVAAALDAARARGPVRVVVNCAGVAGPHRVLDRSGSAAPLEAFRRVVEVNLIGTYNVLRLAAEAMAATEPVDGERGVIINTASLAAFDGQVGQVAYAATKAGVAGMTLPLARDLADRLIRAVTIAPGLFDTPMMAGLPEPAREALATLTPHPSRLGAPEEYAALVEHVVTNPMLNGETIRLDGAVRLPPR